MSLEPEHEPVPLDQGSDVRPPVVEAQFAVIRLQFGLSSDSQMVQSKIYNIIPATIL